MAFAAPGWAPPVGLCQMQKRTAASSTTMAQTTPMTTGLAMASPPYGRESGLADPMRFRVPSWRLHLLEFASAAAITGPVHPGVIAGDVAVPEAVGVRGVVVVATAPTPICPVLARRMKAHLLAVRVRPATARLRDAYPGNRDRKPRQKCQCNDRRSPRHFLIHVEHSRNLATGSPREGSVRKERASGPPRRYLTVLTAPRRHTTPRSCRTHTSSGRAQRSPSYLRARPETGR